MHPLSTKFRVRTLNPFFFKHTINNVVFLCSQTNSALIGGDLSRLKSTLISSSLLLASSGTSLFLLLSKLGLFFFQLSCHWLYVSLPILFLLFSPFLSQLLCLLFIFLLFLLCFQHHYGFCTCEHTWSTGLLRHGPWG